MSTDQLNPYQPPAGEVKETPPANTWSVSGKYLLARPGALLPPVALDGRGKILTPVMWKFSVLAGGLKAIIASVVPVILMVGWMMASDAWLGGQGRWIGVMILAIGTMLVSGRYAKMMNAMVWGFVPVETLRVRSRQHSMARILGRLGLFGLVATVLVMVLTLSSYAGTIRSGFDLDGLFRWLGPAVGVCLLLLIGAAGCSGYKPGLRCVLFKDGWLYLKGVPPESLALLAAKSYESPPGTRIRKVYTTYLHQLPLGSLLGKDKWKPWSAIRMNHLKWTRSPNLEALNFHISERITLPLSDADPDLLAKWKKETAGTPLEQWPLVLANRLDSPQGHTRVEYAFYASPDRQYFVCLTVRRTAVGSDFSECHETILRAWSEDGRSFLTATFRPDHETPDDHHWEQAEGPLPLLWEAHCQRLASVSVRTARDIEEFIKWMESDVAASDAVSEAIGLQSPVREMELPDFPK